MLRVTFAIVVGALIGAVAGYFGTCTGGQCPLTATWWRGALYGGTMGLLLSVTGR